MTQKRLIITASLALFTTCSAFAQNAIDTLPGMWEYSVETKIVGMAIPTQIFRRCLTAQDVAQNKHLTGNQGEKNPCTISDFKNNNGKISFAFDCKNQKSSMKGSTSGSGSSTALNMETRMQMVPPQEGMSDMTQKMKAKRIGDC